MAIQSYKNKGTLVKKAVSSVKTAAQRESTAVKKLGTKAYERKPFDLMR